MTLAGNVWYPVPPLDGQLQQSTDVEVGVTGDGSGGWQLSFRSRDGNFYVQVSAEATDGDGNTYNPTTFFVVTGDQIALGADYAAWKADCDKRYGKWWQLIYASLPPLLSNEPIPPGAPVESEETVVAAIAAQAIRFSDPGAAALLEEAVTRYGDNILSVIARLPGTPTALLPGIS